ncbi:MAG TPA: hypothetical protein PLC65_02095 [Bacteroidia bacterium]|nr:hypothetical protein [Bacteroidia bacterium]
MYEKKATGSLMSYMLAEQHLYGSSRLGMRNPNLEMIGAIANADTAKMYLGIKNYELSNHLGNVLTVISDKKIQMDVNNDNVVDYYVADIISASDYYPFGSVTPGRSFSSGSYRYGYQGSEKEEEFNGTDNTYYTHERFNDARLGKWLSLDSKSKAWESPYVSMGNNPIWFNDVFGAEFDEKSQKRVDQFKENTQAKINTNQIEINKLNVQITELQGGGKDATSLLQKVNTLQRQNDQFESAINEVAVLEAATQLYSINETAQSGGLDVGGTSFDKNSGTIVFNVLANNDANLAHELKHGYQYEMGKTSFDFATGGTGVFYDVQDEVEAYQRQWAWGGLPKVFGGNFDNINAGNVMKINGPGGLQYGSIFNTPDNITTESISTKEFLQHHFGNTYDARAVGRPIIGYIEWMNRASVSGGKETIEKVK